jgi:predicted dehydrogenase
MFVEKPLSCYPVSIVGQVAKYMEEAAKDGLIVSVGYMFRYR